MKPITIVGGGVAGLTLGIVLREREVPVTIWEAGRYSRHCVCGEFISGHGQALLGELGLRGRLVGAGAIFAVNAIFCSALRSGSVRNLPEPALCISRFTLDAFLA